MTCVTLRFYAELNDLLPAAQRQRSFDVCFEGRRTCGELIAEQGVPAELVDLVLVNGRSAPLAQPLADGDRVSVYPVFEAMDIGALTRVRPVPLRRTRFAVDPRLQRLAHHLRLAGFDTVCAAAPSPESMREAGAGGRILLTTEPGLIPASAATHGLHLRCRTPRAQMCEVLHRLQLPGPTLGPRCPRCNLTMAGEDAPRCPGCGHGLRRSTLRLVAALAAGDGDLQGLRDAGGP